MRLFKDVIELCFYSSIAFKYLIQDCLCDKTGVISLLKKIKVDGITLTLQINLNCINLNNDFKFRYLKENMNIAAWLFLLTVKKLPLTVNNPATSLRP